MVVPLPRKRTLNLFQEYVLKLCQAGVRTPELIHERTAIGEYLTQFVILQLKQKGLLSDNAVPTPKALTLLADAAADSFESVSGYVFQDPFTGNLWNRFKAGGLKRTAIEIGYPKHGVPRWSFQTGPAGKAREQMAAPVFPDHTGPEFADKVSPLAVLKACRQHIVAVHHYKRLRSQSDYGREQGKAGTASREDDCGFYRLQGEDLPQAIQQVSLVGLAPEPVFLPTFIFVPDKVQLAGDWQVCDPFGLGPSTQLRKYMEALAGKAQWRFLKEEIKKVADVALEVQGHDLKEARTRRLQDAGNQVKKLLGEGIACFPEVLASLVDLEKAWETAVEFQGHSGSGFDIQQVEIRNFVIGAYTVVEDLLAVVLKIYPSGATFELLKNMPELMAETLSGIAAKKIGFRDNQEGNPFQGFFPTGIRDLVSVAFYDGKNLPAQCAVALAAANDNRSHPLFRLACEIPDWLSLIRDLKPARDKFSHGQTTLTSLDSLEKIHELVYNSAYLLLPGLVNPTGRSNGKKEQDPSWEIDDIYKRRHQAAFRITEKLGLDLFDAPDIKLLFLELEEKFIELELLSDNENSAVINGICREIIIRSCRCLERVLKPLLGQVQGSATLNRSLKSEKLSPELCTAATAAAAAFDFDLLPGGLLPTTLLSTRSVRIQNALRYRSGTLGSMVMALLLSNSDGANHPLAGVAEHSPSFLLEVATLIDYRGHGGSDVQVDAVFCSEIAASIYSTLGAILRVLF